MERAELFDLMGELQLYGMKAAFDEISAVAPVIGENLFSNIPGEAMRPGPFAKMAF
jgi:hypothetical protein